MAIKKPSEGPDPILLTLFANRFMSVAEAMGRSLQQTAISTNIKERLDFSCALFAPDGDLVANAPFIPIHLGSMSLYAFIHGSLRLCSFSSFLFFF
jgi:5-oxoprolinase (ATP-hydrolysing)